jgi:hypothetical protein
VKIALIGDGKMAKAIAPRAEERRHVITAMLGEKDNAGAAGISRERLGNPDVSGGRECARVRSSRLANRGGNNRLV